MPKHAEKRKLPYSAQQMFDLVADVARYPEFLPWTAAARIRRREEQGDHTLMEADLVISFKVFRERFGSRVLLYPAQHRIETDYLDGPFRYLHSHWQFTDIGAGIGAGGEAGGGGEPGCEVDFSVDFEFRNAVLQKVIGVVFDEAMRRIVRAFEERAAALYGNARGGQAALS